MAIRNKVWTTKLVDEVLLAIQEGRPTDTTCFWSNDPEYRAANINFELTAEETQEFIKCSRDVVYFAEKYAYAMTDEGIANISLRPYQERMLREITDPEKRFHVVLASRQVGKCALFNTKIKIKNVVDDKVIELPMFEFRHILMKPLLKTLPLKQRLVYQLKYRLYKIYDWLDK